MILPDPNFFSGDIFYSNNNEDWKKINNDLMLLGIPNKEDNDGSKIANYRGIGLSEMIYSILNNQLPTCSLSLSLHILEIMEGIIESAKKNKKFILTTKPDQPRNLTENQIENLLI